MNIVDENFVPQDEMDREFLKDMQEENQESDFDEGKFIDEFDEEEFDRILDELDKEQKEREKDFGEKLDYFYEHTLAHPDTLWKKWKKKGLQRWNMYGILDMFM